MPCSTTAIIDAEAYRLLKKASLKRKTAISKIVTAILMETAREYLRNASLTGYSAVNLAEEPGSAFPVRFIIDGDLYDVCLAVRLRSKISVSVMLNEGIKRVLRE